MKKILVTGGAGFIGSHTVVELIEAGFEPVVIDNYDNSSPDVLKWLKKITGKDISHHVVDCRDYSALKQVFQMEKDIHAVIHFAAYKAVGESVREPLKYYDNNLGSLVTLLKIMNEAGVANLVFSSSCTVYGQPEKLPVNETYPRVEVESPYGNTKKISEEIIEDVVKTGTLKGITLRYFNPIGAHPSALIGELPNGVPNNLVPYITQTAAGIRESLTIFGNNYSTPDGTCIRDYIHVVDLAKAHVKAVEAFSKLPGDSYNEIFNVGTGRGNSVLEMIKTFEKVSGLKLNYNIGPRRSGDVEQIYSEVDKANNILGWKASLTIEDALQHAWEWQKRLEKEKVS